MAPPFLPQPLQAALMVAVLPLAAGCSSAPLVQDVNPAGRRIVLLLDASSSMAKNDADRTAVTGASVLLGLTGSDDNVGVITYARSADVQVSLGRVTAQKRRAVARALADVPRQGLTNFALALDRAREMLEASDAPRGSPVILLTDGVPFQGPRGLRRPLRMRGPPLKEVVAAIAERGWRIFAIALGEKASDNLLASMVAATGGTVFPVRDASGLQKAFQGAAVEALGYWTATTGRAVPVTPQTARLAFLGTATDEAAVMHDGRPVPAEQVRVTRAGKTHRVYLIESPAAGDWAPAGGLSEAIALVESRFGLEFADGTTGRLVGGSQVPLGIDLVGDEEAVAFVRPRLAIRARFELGDRPWGRSVTLRPAPEDERRFAARFRAPSVKTETPLRVLVEAVLVQKGRAYTLRRTRSFVVTPGKGPVAPPTITPLALSVSPRSVARRCWSDGSPAPATVTLTGDPDRDAVVRAGKQRLKLAAGKTGTLTIPTDAGSLRLRATGPEGASWSGRVRVDLRRYRLTPATIALSEAEAGATSTTTLGLTIQPAATITTERASLKGPTGTTLKGRVRDGQLTVSIPRSAAPGDYRGALTARVDGLPERRVPLTLRVLPPTVKTLPALALQGDWGWVHGTTTIALAGEASPVAVKLHLDALAKTGGARLDPRWDLRLEPSAGWDGERLGRTKRAVKLSVYLSADALPGLYRGLLRVRVGDEDRLRLPIQVTVARPAATPPKPGAEPSAATAPTPAIAVVLDRSASVAQGDPQGRARRLLSLLLALGARPGDRLALVTAPGEALGPVTVDAERAALTPLLEALLAATPRPSGGADLTQALREARQRIGPDGTLLLLTDDDLDPPPPDRAAPRLELAQAAGKALLAEKAALGRLVVLRVPLGQRATPFAEALGATTVELSAHDDAVLARLQRVLWPDAPRIAPRPRPLPVPSRVARFDAAAPLQRVGRSPLWLGALASGADLPPGGAIWAAPQPPALPAGLVGFRLRDGRVRVAAPTIAVGQVEVSRGEASAILEGTPPFAVLPAGEGPVRATSRLTLGAVRLRGPASEVPLRAAELVLTSTGPTQVGTPLTLQGKAPAELVPDAIVVGIAGAAQQVPGAVRLERKGDLLVGTLTPKVPGTLTLVDDPQRTITVRLAQPLVILPAPAPPPPPPPARWPYAVGGGVGLLLLLLGAVAFARRRALAAIVARLGERQLRTINSRGQIGPERHLLADHAHRDGSVRLTVEPTGSLALRLRPDGSIESRGVADTRVVHPDRPQVLADQVVLDHGDVFAVVTGDDAVRLVYLEGPPTAEDLTRSYLEGSSATAAALSSGSASGSDIGWGEGDSERLILIDDDMNVPHFSARLDASTDALFPLATDSAPLSTDSDPLEESSGDPDEISADSERLLIFDSAEEELYHSRDVDFLSSSDTAEPEDEA